MERELGRLRGVAELVSGDLHRTLGMEWMCSVDDLYVVTVTDGRRVERVLLDSRVDEESWPAAAWVDEFREHTLTDDSAEAVAAEVLEVMRLWGVEWPVCVEHGRAAEVCSSTWVCSGPDAHDIGALGALPHFE